MLRRELEIAKPVNQTNICPTAFLKTCSYLRNRWMIVRLLFYRLMAGWKGNWLWNGWSLGRILGMDGYLANKDQSLSPFTFCLSLWYVLDHWITGFWLFYFFCKSLRTVISSDRKLFRKREETDGFLALHVTDH